MVWTANNVSDYTINTQVIQETNSRSTGHETSRLSWDPKDNLDHNKRGNVFRTESVKCKPN
jgi:hypothetical protein